MKAGRKVKGVSRKARNGQEEGHTEDAKKIVKIILVSRRAAEYAEQIIKKKTSLSLVLNPKLRLSLRLGASAVKIVLKMFSVSSVVKSLFSF